MNLKHSLEDGSKTTILQVLKMLACFANSSYQESFWAKMLGLLTSLSHGFFGSKRRETKWTLLSMTATKNTSEIKVKIF